MITLIIPSLSVSSALTILTCSIADHIADMLMMLTCVYYNHACNKILSSALRQQCI